MTKFKNLSGKEFDLNEMVDSIVQFLLSDPNYKYRITIGTDSLWLASKEADFVTAVVVHKIGNGARYFWQSGTAGKFHTLRDRIIKEVLMSLDAAKELLLALQKASEKNDFPVWEFEVHADVGSEGPTKTMLQEVVGMIRAHNFEARTKPESYAASSVADKHV